MYDISQYYCISTIVRLYKCNLEICVCYGGRFIILPVALVAGRTRTGTNGATGHAHRAGRTRSAS